MVMSFSCDHFVPMALLLKDYYLPVSGSERPREDAIGEHSSHRELLLTETIFRTLKAIIVHFHSQGPAPVEI